MPYADKNKGRELRRLYDLKRIAIKEQYDKERREANRDFLISHLGGKCVKCESTDRLEFDHINPNDKSFNVQGSLGSSLERLLEEAKKCQLLCYGCHLKEHGWTKRKD